MNTEVDVPVAVDLGGKLGGLTLNQQIMSLAMWPLLQNLMSVLVGFADRVIAGHVSPVSELGAVIDMMGLMMYMGWLMMIMQASVATGAQALVSRAYGARDYVLAERAVGQSVFLGLVTGAMAGLMLWLLAPMLADFFGLNAGAKVYFLSFIKILVFSAPMSGIVFVLSACLRGAGDTWTPFNAMVVVNLVNGIMSYFFAVYFGMGIEGIALGTVVGWAGGLAMIFWKIYPREAKKSLLVLHRKWMRWNGAISLRIIRVGVPQLVEILGMWSIHAYGLRMIALVGSKDEGLIGSHGLAVQIESLSYMPGFALGTAAATLAGQYLGAGSKELAQQAVRACWRVALVVMSLLGIVLYFNAGWLVSIMSPGGGSQADTAVALVMIVAFTQPFFATAMVMKNSMRGVGATGTVMLYSFSTMFLFRVGLLTLMVYYYGADLRVIWYVFALDVVIQSMVFIWVHYKGKWMDKEV
ncbi:MAG: MATE family efflux transporter [Akkermansiaceae bacterium]